MSEFTMNSATPDFPAEDAPQGAVLDNAPVAPPAGISTELHQEQAAAEARAQQEAEAAKVEADAKAKAEKTEKAEKPTLEESMKRAEAKLLAKAEAEKAKGEAQENQGKARGDDGKFTAKAADLVAQEQTPAPVAAPEAKPSTHPAPQRFHDQAKLDWETAPESIKGEVTRTIRELEQGHQKYRADAEEFSKVREFHELAKSHGTDLRQAVSNYVEVERLLQSDPDKGFTSLLKTINMHPMDAIQSILRANNTTPAQLAAAITSNPQAFNRPAPPRPDPVAQQAMQEVSNIKRELQAEREQNIMARAQADIIAPFRAANPHYDALQENIANILRSGNIPNDLPPQERLQRAYDAAVNEAKRYASMFGQPSPQTAQAQPPLAQTQTQRPANPAGQKSISGAPVSSAPSPTAKKKGPLPSLDESISRAMARR